MAKLVGNSLDFANSAKIINLPNGVNPQDAATVAQLTTAIEGLAGKDNVRAASTGNVTLTSPGTTLDGVTLNNGDRILLKDQTTQSQNGIYIFNGSAATLTRAIDGSQNNDLLSAIVPVDEGTANAQTTWRQTSVAITLGTTNLVWIPFGVTAAPASTTVAGVAALATQSEVNAGSVTNKIVTPQTLAAYTGFPRKISGSIGDGSATQYDFPHNLATNDVTVEVYRNSAPFDTILVDIERPSTSIARIRFAVAPATNAFRVVVVG